jgi:hypothetical protein
MTPYPPPLTHCIRAYCILIHTGKGGAGRIEPERRLEGQQFPTKEGREYQNDWLYLQSINSDKHMPRSPFTVQFFQMTTFCSSIYIVN